MELARQYISPEEYVRLEDAAEERHEYYDSKIYVMAGGSDAHSDISFNIAFALRTRLRGKGCRIYNSEIKVFVEGINFYTYPDLSIVCGGTQFLDGRRDIITNPIVLVEILSKATANYDPSQKFELYRSIPTFQGYLLVDQSRLYVEYHHRTPEYTWVMQTITDIATSLTIAVLNIDVPVAEFYEDVTFAL